MPIETALQLLNIGIFVHWYGLWLQHSVMINDALYKVGQSK